MASLGTEGEVSHSYFLKILTQNALSQGKAGDFAFVMGELERFCLVEGCGNNECNLEYCSFIKQEVNRFGDV
ncbi:hypothetical protein ACFQ21_05275 [Ohtaekwangia kribbensis]|uniref:Uncharacterized protein n=1 Tax=Ohtaekwangia kribbensis TaxID=688913 RepID=A0ABW3JYB4_9BACT